MRGKREIILQRREQDRMQQTTSLINNVGICEDLQDKFKVASTSPQRSSTVTTTNKDSEDNGFENER